MGLAELSDEELVSEYRRRNGAERDAVADHLFERHYQRVARWALRLTNDREAAADLTQDVFLKAHRHLHTFQGAARFTTWLYAIVRNESFSRLSRTRVETVDDDVLSEVAALEPKPDEIAERSDRARHVRQFLAGALDGTERTVFTLHYGDGLSLDAITRLLRLDNASGAKAFIVSARRKLKRAVERLRARGEGL
jgi:RNA polymerase sigma-70 factor (ECF subfamily)